MRRSPCARFLRSAPHDLFHFSCARHSLSINNLKVEGGKAVAEALPKSSLTSLKCAATCPVPFVQRPVNICTFPAPGSLASNNLTARGKDMSGVRKLAEALPQSKLTSLK